MPTEDDDPWRDLYDDLEHGSADMAISDKAAQLACAAEHISNLEDLIVELDAAAVLPDLTPAQRDLLVGVLERGAL